MPFNNFAVLEDAIWRIALKPGERVPLYFVVDTPC